MTQFLCNSSPISQKGGVAVSCPVAVLGTFPYVCALCVNYRKTAFRQFKVAYNNSYRILNRLPMSAYSSMFASDKVNACVRPLYANLFIV